MRFSPRHSELEPEINFIPLIDVLLVILIFLMVTTTYSRFTELQVSLPTANAPAFKEKPNEVIVLVSSDGHYSVDGKLVQVQQPPDLARALMALTQGSPDTVVVISADANATHQSVINAMEAARLANLYKITFAAQTLLKTQ